MAEAAESTEHTILVAFRVFGIDRQQALEDLETELDQSLYVDGVDMPISVDGVTISADNRYPITSWWTAEDLRPETSDGDSAVFVNRGQQHNASTFLHKHGFTQDVNVKPEVTL